MNFQIFRRHGAVPAGLVCALTAIYGQSVVKLEQEPAGSVRVIRVLEQIITERGVPQRIRTDNGPEFTSRCFIAWCLDRRIDLVHIRPGKPVENAHVESFHGRLREECLQVSWFRNLFDARRQIEACDKEALKSVIAKNGYSS